MKNEKIAPGLMVALEDFREKGEAGLRPHSRALGIVAAKGRSRPSKTVVFIHGDEQRDFERLARHNIEVNQGRGRIRTAYLPLDSLDALSEDAAVDRIVPARYLRPLMDAALGKTHAVAFRQQSELAGRGVLLGIIDTGIDATHPAFSGRILRIWDQTLPGPGVPEGRYGAELPPSLLTVSRDSDGHGTHVAGIAGASDNKFPGVATDADFVIVKTDFMDAHIADAVRYIFRIASELNRPAVLNLSLGGHADAHDGTDSLSQIIDGESGVGRIVCCAAGNEGNDNIHAQTNAVTGRPRTMRFRVPSGVPACFLNGWYPGNCSLEVSIRTPGRFVTNFQPVITTGSFVRPYQLPDARVWIATPGPDPANGDHNLAITIEGPTPELPVSTGSWQLRIRNPRGPVGQLDVWILDQETATFFTGKSVQDSMKIGSPGAATSALSVASYTTKVQWTDIDSQVRTVGLDPDDISDFTSEGPLRNGSQKPDVAAPGAMVVSCLSGDSNPRRSSMVDTRFVMNAGTSMATPFIAGIVALLLERDPKLDPPAVKALLTGHCSIPGKASGTFDPKWGFGFIDAQGF
jgi:subtilisin family serine protease